MLMHIKKFDLLRFEVDDNLQTILCDPFQDRDRFLLKKYYPSFWESILLSAYKLYYQHYNAIHYLIH